MQIKRQSRSSRSHFKQITTIIWYTKDMKHEDNYIYVLLEFHLKLIISLTFRGIAFVIFLLHVLLRLNEGGRIQRKISVDQISKTFCVSFVDCKTVILRKANIVKISLKKCNLFFPYFVHGRLHNWRLKTLISPVWFSRQIGKNYDITKVKKSTGNAPTGSSII